MGGYKQKAGGVSVWREPLYWNGLIAATVFWCAASLLALLVLWWHDRRQRRPRRAAPSERQVRREQLREALTDDTAEQERIR